MDGQDERATGRERVRLALWDRLDEAGMKPAIGQTQDAHGEMRKRLGLRFGYMTDANLATLAETLIDQGSGAKHDRLPGEATIVGLARALQKEPVTQKRIVTSWLASVEGPKARAGGYEVALFRWLQRSTGRPPMAFDMTRIVDQGRDDLRMAKLIEDRIARNVVSADDRNWLSAYIADRDAVAAIIAEGDAKRAAEAAA
ncbi:MAG: hypothetical protein AAGF30_00425 [Pseudomonadota bacterium]